MKGLKLILILVAMAVAANSLSMEVPVERVFAPNGFNSDDSAQVVVSGYLPDLCYYDPYAQVEVNENVIDIKMLSKHSGGNKSLGCAELVRDFLQPVDLGVLDQGDYEVRVNGIKSAELEIVESESDAFEDISVALVADVKVDQEVNLAKIEVWKPSDCYEFEELDIKDNGVDVYSVIPKMKKVSDFCPMKVVPVDIELNIPNYLQSEKVLLHIRSIDGKSFNSVMKNF